MNGPRIAIVGGGIYGWSCALRAAELGARVTVFDPRAIDDADRASGGTTRVLRLEYGEAAVYTELTLRARDRWRQIERDTGTPLYRECGVLFMVPVGDSGEWERSSYRVTSDAGHGGQELSPADLATRWPSIRPEGVEWALYNPIGGYMWANRATATVAGIAVDAGVEFVAHAVAESDATGVTLDDGTRCDADVVVVTTGSWTAGQVPGIAIRPTRQVVTYLAGGPDDIPVFSDGAPFAMYGMPAHDGFGLKIASHATGRECDPDDPANRVATAEEVATARELAERRFVVRPGASAVVRTEVCFYAMTPTEDPMIGRLSDGRVICAGFSGHGFKFAPIVGAAVAELALGRETSVDLGPFNPESTQGHR